MSCWRLLQEIPGVFGRRVVLVRDVRRTPRSCQPITDLQPQPDTFRMHTVSSTVLRDLKVLFWWAMSVCGYLADDIQLVTDTDRCKLRSAAARTCFVPRTHNSFGDRSFSAAGRRVWNSLPPHLRQAMNFAWFQHKLKTFLFGSLLTTAHRDCYSAP